MGVGAPVDRTSRVVVCAAVRFYREGLADALARREGMEVVAAAATPAEAAERARALGASVVLVDVAEGADAFAVIHATAPFARVVAVGLRDVTGELVRCAEAGAAGYVDHRASLDELVETVRAVERGEMPCSPAGAAALARRVRELSGGGGTSAAVLTPREAEVVALLAEGLPNKAIAARLTIELPTVKHHVHSVIRKVGARNRSEAVAVCRRRGLLVVPRD